MVAHVGYQHSSYEGGLSEKDAHSSGYVEKLFNFTTYKVPELKKSPLVHEESHQFRQLLKASKDCTCCLSRSAGLMYVFNYSWMFFLFRTPAVNTYCAADPFNKNQFQVLWKSLAAAVWCKIIQAFVLRSFRRQSQCQEFARFPWLKKIKKYEVIEERN